MIRDLRIHQLAEAELADAGLWYDQKQPGLGTTLLELTNQAVEKIRLGVLPSNPVLGVAAANNARRVMLRPFPYSIVFYEHANQIVIIAFAHSSRRPGYWRSRKI